MIQYSEDCEIFRQTQEKYDFQGQEQQDFQEFKKMQEQFKIQLFNQLWNEKGGKNGPGTCSLLIFLTFFPY